MTYAERVLKPLGFNLIEQSVINPSERLDREDIRPGIREKVVLTFSHLKLQFDCVCPSHPHIKALGCPLHHEGLGSSWPVEEAKQAALVIGKTILTFEGYPKDGGLFTGYNVLRYGEKIGFIEVCGIFRKTSKLILLNEWERYLISEMCKKVYEMPSEYGCLGVGEPPTELFEDFVARTNFQYDLEPTVSGGK